MLACSQAGGYSPPSPSLCLSQVQLSSEVSLARASLAIIREALNAQSKQKGGRLGAGFDVFTG